MASIRDCLVADVNLQQNEALFYYEFDVSQLEICVLAALSEDMTLITELFKEVDIHSRNYSEFYSVPIGSVTDEQRKFAKSRTFELQYGSSAYGMAKGAGISKKAAEDFIALYYDKYTGVSNLHEELEYTVYHNAATNTQMWHSHKGSHPIGYYYSPMGVKFSFIPYEWERDYKKKVYMPSHMYGGEPIREENWITGTNFEWMPALYSSDSYCFSRPQILNYICQGMGYQVVNLLRNTFISKSKEAPYHHLNITNRLEIHDSEAGTAKVLFNDTSLVEDSFQSLMKDTLVETKRLLTDVYGWDIWKYIPLKVEYKIAEVNNLGVLRNDLIPTSSCKV